MSTTVVDLVGMISELGSDGAATELNKLIEEARTEGYNRGKDEGWKSGRSWSERTDTAKITGWWTMGISAAVIFIIWAATGIGGCMNAGEKQKAEALAACKAGDFGICLKAYKDEAGSSSGKPELYSETYKNATGQLLVPPAEPSKIIDGQKLPDGSYTVKSGDTTITIRKN